MNLWLSVRFRFEFCFMTFYETKQKLNGLGLMNMSLDMFPGQGQSHDTLGVSALTRPDSSDLIDRYRRMTGEEMLLG